ncbi:MAG: alanine racemase [Culicoidibacterales bacterium]
MKSAIHRDTWLEIDITAIQSNIKNIKKYYAKEKHVFAVVKADAYHHGAVAVAQAALIAGVHGLCVSNLDEGIELREAGIQAPILVVGKIAPHYLAVAQKYMLQVTVSDWQWLEQALAYSGKPVQVHLKYDSGMNRLGVKTHEEMQKLLMTLSNHESFEIVGLFTHFATSDDSDETAMREQYTKFIALLDTIGMNFQYIHASNSYGTIRLADDERTNSVRLGILMYGCADEPLDLPFTLQPAMGLYSRLLEVKQVRAGEKVGYGLTYTCTEDGYIGIVPIGYADGWWRKNQGRYVFIQGYMCEIIGRICMDQLMVRLPKLFSVMSLVELFGPHIPIQTVAKELGTISYEVMCGIDMRVPKVFKNTTEK